MLNQRYLLPLLIISAFIKVADAAASTCELNTICNIRLQHPSINEWLEPVLTATDTVKLGEKVGILDQLGKPGKIAGVNKDVELGKATKTGGIYAAENISLAEGSVVVGNLAAKKILRTSSTIATTQVSLPSQPTVSLWKISFKSKGTKNVDVKSAMALEPGRYQKVSLRAQAKLTLKTGIYYFDSLETRSKSEIVLENKKGTVLIYVRDQLVHLGRFTTKNTPSDVMVVYFGSKPIDLTSEFDGSLIAPLADVAINAITGAVHDGIFYAKKIVVKDSAIIRGVSPTRKGPILAELKAALKNDAPADYANSDLPPPDSAGFSNTPTGRLLANHLKDMYGYGPNAEAQYQANLELLRKDAKAAVAELSSRYENTPNTLTNQEMKWSLVQIMADLKNPEAFDALRKISQSPITTVDTSAFRNANEEHPVDGQKWEHMIRSRAIDGISQLAKTGHYGANEALLQSATTTTGTLQRYAITGYLAAGSDYQNRINDLQKILPKDQQHLLNLTQDISKVAQATPAEGKQTDVPGASAPVQ